MTFRKAVELADDPVRLGRLTVTITPADLPVDYAGRDRRIAGLKCRRVTEFASDRAEQNFSARDRLGAAWRIG